MMRPPRSPTERMSPLESKAIADNKSCLPIADAFGSPKLLRNVRFSGSQFSIEPILFYLPLVGLPIGELHPIEVASEKSFACFRNDYLYGGDIGGEIILDATVDPEIADISKLCSSGR